MVMNPAFIDPRGAPHRTPPHLIFLSTTEPQRGRQRKMSGDPASISQFRLKPDSTGKENSFDTTGSYNINHNSLNNCNNSFNTNTNIITITEERSEILTWLSPLDPNLRHHDVQMRQVDDVGDWLLRTKEFQSWHSGGLGEAHKAALFCSGNPGVGKTYIR